MLARLKHPGWLIVAQLAACWPVWLWYIRRMTDGSDEPLGILALVTAWILVWREWRNQPMPVTSGGESGQYKLLPSAVLLFVYAVTYSICPPLIRAALAVTALSLTLSRLILGVRFHLALTGLLLLSLPVVSSLQFYLGYPLRRVCGFIALPILGLAGFPVSLEGTCLRCGDLLVSIDAPCSGIRMLWAGLFLSLVLVCLYRLKPTAVLIACGISLLLVILANSIRTIALVILELILSQRFPWLHDLTGLLIFMTMGVTLMVVTRQLAGGWPCARRAFS